jgi:2,4-dienoyl-CoA reductase-like NADH-dependent reductase (Old Yellow Enzyme family)
MSTSPLFTPLTLRDVTLPNRLLVSPMSQYAAQDGFAGDWHLVNAGRFAMGGFGTVMLEATAVTKAGRGTPGDLGLWCDDQIAPLARIGDFVRAHGSVPAIQLNHAGPKGARRRPWDGGALDGADADRGEATWPIAGPIAEPFAPDQQVPQMLDAPALAELAEAWGLAAARAARAGFDILEIHAAHGYLLHQFLSSLGNRRDDGFGGDRSGRMRFPLMVVEAVRASWPDHLPLFLRLSITDWIDGGWTIEDSIAFGAEVAARGVDLVDCSSGGFGFPQIATPPGFQVPFAARIRHESHVATAAVGLILDGVAAEKVIRDGDADLVAIGREALIDPNWALRARAAVEQLPSDFGHWPTRAGWWLDRRRIG